MKQTRAAVAADTVAADTVAADTVVAAGTVATRWRRAWWHMVAAGTGQALSDMAADTVAANTAQDLPDTAGGRHLGHRVFGNRAIANVALQSRFGAARFHGGFFGSAWPWWRGGLVLGWFGPLFWPYAHYDLFDYVYWPYAYDDFWPYAYDDIYYGIYGPYAYYGPSAPPASVAAA